MKILLIILYLSIFIFSCNSRQKEPKHPLVKETSDTVVKHIPERSSNSEERFAQLENFLGISSLSNGFHDYQVRIWFEYNRLDTQQVVCLKEQSSEWQGEFYYYVPHYVVDKDGNLELTKIDKRSEVKTPKSGWKSFADSLNAMLIDNLADFTKIDNYHLATDVDVISVEIAKPTTYRFYRFPAFEWNKGEFDDTRKFSGALELIKKEFGFQKTR